MSCMKEIHQANENMKLEETAPRKTPEVFLKGAYAVALSVSLF